MTDRAGKWLSDCHNAPVRVVGTGGKFSTNHWECTECEKSCNAHQTAPADISRGGFDPSDPKYWPKAPANKPTEQCPQCKEWVIKDVRHLCPKAIQLAPADELDDLIANPDSVELVEYKLSRTLIEQGVQPALYPKLTKQAKARLQKYTEDKVVAELENIKKQLGNDNDELHLLAITVANSIIDDRIATLSKGGENAPRL